MSDSDPRVTAPYPTDETTSLPPVEETRGPSDDEMRAADEGNGVYRVAPKGSPVSFKAHLTSLVACLLLVPVAYALLDYASARSFTETIAEADPGAHVATGSVVAAVVAALAMLLAAALGRLSALGPFAAGVVWGVVPMVVALVQPARLLYWVREATDAVDLYDGQLLYLASNGLVVFTISAGLLLGVALPGRWLRRPR